MRKLPYFETGIALLLIMSAFTLVPRDSEQKNIEVDLESSPHTVGVASSENVAPVKQVPPFRGIASLPIVSASPATLTGTRRLIDGEVISSEKQMLDNEGSYLKIQVLKTSFKYPMVRVEQRFTLNTQTGEIEESGRNEMVGDHVIVKLQPGATEADLKRIANQYGGEIRESIGNGSLYLVSFDGHEAHALPQFSARLQKESVIGFSEPDFIVHAF